MMPLNSALVTGKLPAWLAITAAATAAAVIATATAATAIAAAAEAATVTAIAATTATTAAATIFAGTSFVDVQGATVNLFAVKLRDRRFAFFLGCHFDKAEAA